MVIGLDGIPRPIGCPYAEPNAATAHLRKCRWPVASHMPPPDDEPAAESKPGQNVSLISEQHIAHGSPIPPDRRGMEAASVVQAARGHFGPGIARW